MANNDVDLKLSPQNLRRIAQVVYGEETQDPEIQKMVIQSVLGRYLSGRPEFTKDIG